MTEQDLPFHIEKNYTFHERRRTKDKTGHTYYKAEYAALIKPVADAMMEDGKDRVFLYKTLGLSCTSSQLMVLHGFIYLINSDKSKDYGTFRKKIVIRQEQEGIALRFKANRRFPMAMIDSGLRTKDVPRPQIGGGSPGRPIEINPREKDSNKWKEEVRAFITNAQKGEIFEKSFKGVLDKLDITFLDNLFLGLESEFGMKIGDNKRFIVIMRKE